MSRKFSLSIIIPVYNEESHLRGCLEAVAAQAVRPDEVIVVDNGSTDNSVKIAKSFPFVRVIREKRPSVLYARTAGYNVVKTDLIGRVDADTLLDPDWVARAKQFFDDPNVHAVTGPSGIYDMPFPRFTRWLHDVLLRIAVFGGYHFLTGSNMVMRRSSWRAVASELCDDLSLFEDTDLAIHMERNGMTPTYSPKLCNMVSARRFRDRLPQFIQYMRRHSRTLSSHGVHVPGAYHAQIAYGVTYFVGKPLHRLFDPKKRRLSIKHAWQTPETRIDPMDGRVKITQD